MAPRHRLALCVVVAALVVLVSAAAADDGGTTTVEARGGVAADDGYLGDNYVGCLEMGLARCMAQPTVVCVEDAIVGCSLQGATAAAPGPAAPEAAKLLLGAVGGGVARGIFNLGVKYVRCVALNLAANCYVTASIRCVEDALAC